MTDPTPAEASASVDSTRELPAVEHIGDWIDGAELPTLAALFDNLDLKRFDTLINQVRKQEILPQHWQVISHRESLDEKEFDNFPAVRGLRSTSKNQPTAERRVAALMAAWHQLGGKQPALWTVPDLFAAMRRLIERQIEINFYDLLAAVRDVWRGTPLPSGREHLEILWASLAFIRQKTKK